MSLIVTVINNAFEPDKQTDFVGDNLFEIAQKIYPKGLPLNTYLYHDKWDSACDITPKSDADIDHLNRLTGRFYLVTYPSAALPLLAVVAISVGVSLAVAFLMPKPEIPNTGAVSQRGGENIQHQRLQNAQDLLLKVRPDADENLQAKVRECALKACSWGLGQIMVFNHKLAGFDNLQGFINAMYDSEKAQLQATIGFLKSAGLGGAMKRKDWQAIAKVYNGVAYAKFDYHNKLARAYENA